MGSARSFRYTRNSIGPIKIKSPASWRLIPPAAAAAAGSFFRATISCATSCTSTATTSPCASSSTRSAHNSHPGSCCFLKSSRGFRWPPRRAGRSVTHRTAQRSRHSASVPSVESAGRGKSAESPPLVLVLVSCRGRAAQQQQAAVARHGGARPRLHGVSSCPRVLVPSCPRVPVPPKIQNTPRRLITRSLPLVSHARECSA